MDLNSYAFEKVRGRYEFYSMGPKGRIKKAVQFSLEYPRIFNLGFGDWIEEDEQMDDVIVTNNHDRDRVLATVAKILIQFLKEHPKATVFIRGSTKSRNRLYKMIISKYWKAIIQLFELNGFTEKGWEVYQKNKDYEGYFINLKYEQINK